MLFADWFELDGIVCCALIVCFFLVLVVRCSLFVVRCVLRFARWSSFCCLFCVCVVVRCLSFDACCSLLVVGCVRFVVLSTFTRCLSFVVWWLVFVVGCGV